MTEHEEYWKYVESERHFNEIQSGIRNHAATWMLAAFAAIALLLKMDKDVQWLVSPAVLVGVICFMATLGLLVLWINDQLVYQRLLDSSFIIALKKEFDNPGLPPIRSMMMFSAEGKGMSRWMTFFYTIPMWVFLAATGAAAILRQGIGCKSQGMSEEMSLLTLIVLWLGQLGATLWVQRKKMDVGAKARAALFGDDQFTAMFDGNAAALGILAGVIARHHPGDRDGSCEKSRIGSGQGS